MRGYAIKTADLSSSMDTFGPLQEFATRTANACSFMDSFGLTEISAYSILHRSLDMRGKVADHNVMDKMVDSLCFT